MGTGALSLDRFPLFELLIGCFAIVEGIVATVCIGYVNDGGVAVGRGRQLLDLGKLMIGGRPRWFWI
jgi:hypothetical protein